MAFGVRCCSDLLDGNPLLVDHSNLRRLLFVPLGLGNLVAVSLLHGVINVLDHANLVLPWRLACLSNNWSTRHDLRHTTGGNFANITPVWDRLFRTAAR